MPPSPHSPTGIRPFARSLWRFTAITGFLLAVGGTLWAVWERIEREHLGTVPATRLEPMIAEASRRNGVSPFLIKAVILQESGFRPLARGTAGEIGLMQLTPAAVTDWERGTGFHLPHRGQIFDARLNIEIGTWYLARGITQWQGTADPIVPALAQYNAGRRNALKWHGGALTGPQLERVRFSSTHTYIKSILNFCHSFESDYTRREIRKSHSLRSAQSPPG